MRQSLRIIEQCINKMPAGEYKVKQIQGCFFLSRNDFYFI